MKCDFSLTPLLSSSSHISPSPSASLLLLLVHILLSPTHLSIKFTVLYMRDSAAFILFIHKTGGERMSARARASIRRCAGGERDNLYALKSSKGGRLNQNGCDFIGFMVMPLVNGARWTEKTAVRGLVWRMGAFIDTSLFISHPHHFPQAIHLFINTRSRYVPRGFISISL